MALKSAMVGTRKELHAPFPERSMAILRRDHPFYTDAASLSVFTKEYFLLPRYPCFEEERVGAWGAGGKARIHQRNLALKLPCINLA